MDVFACLCVFSALTSCRIDVAAQRIWYTCIVHVALVPKYEDFVPTLVAATARAKAADFMMLIQPNTHYVALHASGIRQNQTESHAAGRRNEHE